MRRCLHCEMAEGEVLIDRHCPLKLVVNQWKSIQFVWATADRVVRKAILTQLVRPMEWNLASSNFERQSRLADVLNFDLIEMIFKVKEKQKSELI